MLHRLARLQEPCPWRGVALRMPPRPSFSASLSCCFQRNTQGAKSASSHDVSNRYMDDASPRADARFCGRSALLGARPWARAVASDSPCAYCKRCAQTQVGCMMSCAALMQQKRVRHGTICVLRSLALVTHHGLVEEWEPLHGGERVGRGRDVRKHDPGLPPQPVGLHAYDVQDLSELGEYGVQTFLQLCREGHRKASAENAKSVRAQRDWGRLWTWRTLFLELLVQVADIDCGVRSVAAHRRQESDCRVADAQ